MSRCTYLRSSVRPTRFVKRQRLAEKTQIRLCEHAFLTYGDALLWLFELADKGDRRFREAAGRWHALLVLEAKLPLGESEMMLKMLCGITGANRLVLRRRLLARVEQEGLTLREMSVSAVGRKSV